MLARAGIGDFACFQWTGWFPGEAGRASANTILKAVRGNESLDLRYVATPPISPGYPVPDGNATARVLAQAAVDAGWGIGQALSVPSAPPVGPQTTTNNPACALVSADRVKQAFDATMRAQVIPGENNCRYTFSALNTPGPDSLNFSVDLQPGGASSMPGRCRRRIEGIGDSAIFIIRSEPVGSKSFGSTAVQPTGDAPITSMLLMVTRGQNMAIFGVQMRISPTGPTAEQVRDRFIALVKGINF